MSSTETGRSRLPFVAIGVVVALVATAVWYFAFRRPSAAALGERDTLLVADFVNTSGEPLFDDGLRQAVWVQLQQTPFLTLVPDQRIQRTLRLMQRPGEEALTGDLARQACQRAGARATVDGSIAAGASAFVITLEVTDCATGASLARWRGEAATRDEVLNQLGAGLTEVRRSLGEPSTSLARYNAPIATATTASLEALRAYGQGVRFRATRGDDAAIPLFEQAVRHDPAFAIAYAKLGVVTGNVGRLDDAREHAKKAWELREKTTEYERLYMNWNYAARVLQDQKAVRASLEELTTTYPRDFAARNNFGVYFNNNGEFEDALKQYRAASEIAPDEPGPISNAAYVLLYLGRFDEASADVDRVLTMRPDANLAIARWLAARLMNHARAAEFGQVARQLANPDQVAFAESAVAAWEGRLAEYNRILAELVERARAAGNEDLVKAADVGASVTRAMYLQGSAIDALRAAAARERDPYVLSQYVSALAMLGDVAPARAALGRLDKEAGQDQGVSASTEIARAYVLARDGRPAEGIALLERTLAALPRAQDLHFMIADLHAQAGHDDQAIAGFRRVIGATGYLAGNPIIPAARLKLTRLLMKRNDTAGAKEQLDALLAQWKNADTEFPMLTETKALRGQIKN